jgi:hypothetical protein
MMKNQKRPKSRIHGRIALVALHEERRQVEALRPRRLGRASPGRDRAGVDARLGFVEDPDPAVQDDAPVLEVLEEAADAALLVARIDLVGLDAADRLALGIRELVEGRLDAPPLAGIDVDAHELIGACDLDRLELPVVEQAPEVVDRLARGIARLIDDEEQREDQQEDDEDPAHAFRLLGAGSSVAGAAALGLLLVRILLVRRLAHVQFRFGWQANSLLGRSQQQASPAQDLPTRTAMGCPIFRKAADRYLGPLGPKFILRFSTIRPITEIAEMGVSRAPACRGLRRERSGSFD